MKGLALTCLFVLAAHHALAQAPIWERGRDERYEVAVAGIGPGTTLGFFCSAHYC